MQADVKQGASELSFVAERTVSEPRRMSRTGKRMSPVCDMVE